MCTRCIRFHQLETLLRSGGTGLGVRSRGVIGSTAGLAALAPWLWVVQAEVRGRIGCPSSRPRTRRQVSPTRELTAASAIATLERPVARGAATLSRLRDDQEAAASLAARCSMCVRAASMTLLRALCADS